MTPPFPVQRTTFLHDRRLARRARRAQVDDRRQAVLEAVHRHPGSSATHVARLLGLNANSVAGHLLHLVRGKQVRHERTREGVAYFPA
jgi:predicted transcriptional regulator